MPKIRSDEERLRNLLSSMRHRCYNTTDDRYHRYGGRGIKVCKEWLESPGKFYAWALANGYSAELQIDRINNDGDYDPNNCRWVTCQTNNRNRSNNRHIEAFGKQQCLAEWAEDPLCTVSYALLRMRLWQGWTFEEALTVPSSRTHRRARGEANSKSKLTSEQVREVRRRYAEGGISQTELGKTYGITQTAISCIITGKAWKEE